MALLGTLAEFQVDDILMLLSGTAKTGVCLTLTADAEGIDGVGHARAQERRDPLALEEPLEHQRLRPVAAAHLAEAAFDLRLGRELRRRGRLPSRRHGREYNPVDKGVDTKGAMETFEYFSGIAER